MSDDVDLEALFDEISAKTLPTTSSASTSEASNGSDTASQNDSSSSVAPVLTLSPDNTPSLEDQRDKPMYERLGGIVRLLHDSMRELGYDRSLTDVASQIGDAQGRLEHVATLTEQAANKVLNAIDQSMPAQEKLSVSAQNINQRWEQLFNGQLSVEEFKTLANDSKVFSATVMETTEVQKARMLEIMMAQDFQDITGQLIKKIVSITTVAERELAQLLRDNAPPEIKAAIADKPVELLNGPSAPGAALEQNDVDDLLDSLGF